MWCVNGNHEHIWERLLSLAIKERQTDENIQSPFMPIRLTILSDGIECWGWPSEWVFTHTDTHTLLLTWKLLFPLKSNTATLYVPRTLQIFITSDPTISSSEILPTEISSEITIHAKCLIVIVSLKSRNKSHPKVQQDNGFINYDVNIATAIETILIWRGGKTEIRIGSYYCSFVDNMYAYFRTECLLWKKRSNVCFSFQNNEQLVIIPHPLLKTTEQSLICWAYFTENGQGRK